MIEVDTVVETYLDEATLPYPFCPGCGHGFILNHLNAALAKLNLDPRQVVIVTDIGCVGLSDRHFITNTFHGLHGRSVTYGTGIKLANSDLKVIVLMGDGACGIGGHHLINAARRNIGVTVLIFNNFNFGMTGGEHSVMTPHGATTATTRLGNLERPLDICSTVAINGAGFVARKTSFDKDLPDLIAEAIDHEGFSLIDIWELCTAYYVPNNRFSKKALEATLDGLGYETGILHREHRPEYSRAYREAAAPQLGQPAMTPTPLGQQFESAMHDKTHLIIAGKAGQKIRSAAGVLAQGAMLSGLWATQRDDYPVTIMTGHSVSEVILSPEEIRYTGIARPDLMAIISWEGLDKTHARLAELTEDNVLYITRDLLPVETRARIRALDLSAATGRVTRTNRAMICLSAVLRDTGLFPMAALEEAIRCTQRPSIAEENLAAVASSEGVVVED